MTDISAPSPTKQKLLNAREPEAKRSVPKALCSSPIRKKTAPKTAVQQAALANVAQKVKRRSKIEVDADVKRLLEVDGKAKRRVEAEAIELAKLSPTELVKRWEENERKIRRSCHKGDIYNATWQTLIVRSLKLEELIRRRQSTMTELIAKLRFLEDRIDPDHEDCVYLAISCRLDAEAIESIAR
jgi:hypothetical protein